MKALRRFARRLTASLFGRSDDDRLRAELAEHLSSLEEEFVRAGMLPDEARRHARLTLGPSDAIVEAYRDEQRLRSLEGLWQDMAYALRTLRRTPGFALVAVATLALGIGANTALFSVFNSLVLRPLPVRDPDRLAFLTDGDWSYPFFGELERHAALFDGAFAWSNEDFNLSQGGQIDRVDGAYASGHYFELLGVAAVRGRMLVPSDDTEHAANAAVAVISARLWHERFGGADDVIGRQLTLDGIPFTVVGVMPPGFFGLDVGRMTDVIVPFASEPLIRGEDSSLENRGSIWLEVMVRLKPGQTVEQANAALRGIQPRIRAATMPETRTLTPYLSDPLTLAAAATGTSPLRTRFETPLFAMIAGVGLVLIVACANIAGLLLARALGRRRELSVRLALGGSRWRLASLLLTESALIAAVGAALGLVFAKWSGALLVRQLTTWQASVSLNLALDWRVLAFVAALACLSAIIPGVAPVIWLKGIAAGDALTDAGRGVAGDRRLTLCGALVVAQIAISLVLVVGSGLFLRTFASLSRLPLGFEPEPLVIVDLNLKSSAPEDRARRVERLREAVSAVPEVTSAAVSTIQILSGGGWRSNQIAVGDEPVPPPSRSRQSWLNATTPGWFKTMGIRFRSGRDFTEADRRGSPQVAIVNEAFAQRFLAGQPPLGQTVRLAPGPGGRCEIVGLVADAVYTSPRDGMVATMYVPLAQSSAGTYRSTVPLTIQAAPGRRAAAARAVAVALSQADPTIGFTFKTFDQLVAATVTQERLIASLSTFFGGFALLLAAIGLYGTVAHSLRARRTEIGLRMALGARSGDVVGLLLRQVGVLLMAGLAIGLAGSLWAATFVSALLFRLEPRDPVTFAASAAVLIVVGVLAAWVPARRATLLDPANVLRNGS